jgi:hypothetical protein
VNGIDIVFFAHYLGENLAFHLRPLHRLCSNLESCGQGLAFRSTRHHASKFVPLQNFLKLYPNQPLRKVFPRFLLPPLQLQLFSPSARLVPDGQFRQEQGDPLKRLLRQPHLRISFCPRRQLVYI